MAKSDDKQSVTVVWNGMMVPEPGEPRIQEGVTPEMMIWWSMNRNKERYRMVHPDHIDFKTVYKPNKGRIGTRFYHKERHGKYMERTKFLVEGISDTTVNIAIKTRGFTNRTNLVFEAVPGGTKISSTQIIGSDNPIWGRIWNFITRKFLYTADYRAAVAEHVRREFGPEGTPKYLPDLYAENAGKEE